MTRRTRNFTKPHADQPVPGGAYQSASGRGLLLVFIAMVAILAWAVLT